MKNQTSIYRTKLLAKLHILITQQGVDKEALYSSFGVESATQMNDAELIECVNLLEGNDPRSAMISYGEREMRQKRSQILSVLTKSPNPKVIKNRGLGVPNDWAILNPFIEKLAGKRLSKMAMVEMDHFLLQLFKMREKGWVWSDRFKERLNEEPQDMEEIAQQEFREAYGIDKGGEPIEITPATRGTFKNRSLMPLFVKSDGLPS